MSLVASMLQNIRRNDEKFYKNSLRIGEYGAFELYKEQSNDPNGIIDPATKEEAWYRSQGRTFQMTVLDPNTNITISNVRSCYQENDDICGECCEDCTNCNHKETIEVLKMAFDYLEYLINHGED